MILGASESLGFTYGYSRCPASRDENVYFRIADVWIDFCGHARNLKSNG